MPEIDDWIHPLELLAKREPLKEPGVQVVVLARDIDTSASSVGRGLVKLLEQRKLVADFVVAPVHPSWGEAITSAVEATEHPVVLVTSSQQVWSLAHLDPLLKAIDSKDHVVGRRPLPILGRLKRWLKHLPARWLFGCPILDVHSPCTMHRKEALVALPLQSKSWFADVEWVAKATYLKHVIDEVPVPAMDGLSNTTPERPDFWQVWSKPTFGQITTT